MTSGMKVLLIGSGGREHALAWKLSHDASVTDLICAPGNPGIAEVSSVVDVKADDVIGLLALAQREAPDLVVVGPEAPLAAGLADMLMESGIAVFGPTQAAAQLESSKAFTKGFCDRHAIPTAAYATFDNLEKAIAYVEKRKPPFVLKADGLAAGKGVVIAEDLDTAKAELAEFFSGKFGDASTTVVIEEFMEGQEVSFFALTDGEHSIPLIGCQDHKRVGEGDTGPNTGGMGAYSPTPIFDEAMETRVMQEIIGPTVSGMAAEGMPFAGVLFAGLMITADGPKLIEYNVRFGDPECQVVMRRLASELAPMLAACATGKLAKAEPPTWFDDPVVNVVMATQGYPGAYEKGSVIEGVDAANAMDDVIVFHAGTRRGRNCGKLKANGGRVLNVTASGATLREAVDRAYAAVDAIDWPEGFVRRDIAHRALG